MKLELKHLAPYLPYRLIVKRRPFSEVEELTTHHLQKEWVKDVIPILRPLSDLTKEIEVNREKFIPKNRLRDLIMIRGNYSNYDSTWINESLDIYLLPYWMIDYLLEWHFDVFGLIEKGLAIDINTLNNN